MDLALPIDRQSASLRSQVANRLRAEITSGRLVPGARLIERELCERLAVSRPLLREVLRQLESEGLITNIPYRGPSVTRLTPEEAREVYRVRGVLEALASQLFATDADAAAKRRLREAFERLAVAYASGDAADILIRKTEFYDTLLAGSGNRVAHALLKQLHARVTLLRATSLSRPERLQASIDEVRKIVEAIEAGNGDAAWKATIEHIDRATIAALGVLRAHQQPDEGKTVS